MRTVVLLCVLLCAVQVYSQTLDYTTSYFTCPKFSFTYGETLLCEVVFKDPTGNTVINDIDLTKSKVSITTPGWSQSSGYPKLTITGTQFTVRIQPQYYYNHTILVTYNSKNILPKAPSSLITYSNQLTITPDYSVEPPSDAVDVKNFNFTCPTKYSIDSTTNTFTCYLRSVNYQGELTNINTTAVYFSVDAYGSDVQVTVGTKTVVSTGVLSYLITVDQVSSVTVYVYSYMTWPSKEFNIAYTKSNQVKPDTPQPNYDLTEIKCPAQAVVGAFYVCTVTFYSAPGRQYIYSLGSSDLPYDYMRYNGSSVTAGDYHFNSTQYMWFYYGVLYKPGEYTLRFSLPSSTPEITISALADASKLYMYYTRVGCSTLSTTTPMTCTIRLYNQAGLPADPKGQDGLYMSIWAYDDSKNYVTSAQPDFVRRETGVYATSWSIPAKKTVGYASVSVSYQTFADDANLGSDYFSLWSAQINYTGVVVSSYSVALPDTGSNGNTGGSAATAGGYTTSRINYYSSANPSVDRIATILLGLIMLIVSVAL